LKETYEEYLKEPPYKASEALPASYDVREMKALSLLQKIRVRAGAAGPLLLWVL
jgi:hypothetical protein